MESSSHKVYLEKETVDSLIDKLPILFTRVIVSSNHFKFVGKPLKFDCIKYNGYLIWSSNKAYIEQSGECVISEILLQMPSEWNNPNTRNVLEMLVTKKNLPFQRNLRKERTWRYTRNG